MDIKKVKELTLRAGITIDTFGTPVIDNLHQLGNFADIIVRECGKILNKDDTKKTLFDSFEIKDTPPAKAYVPQW